MNKPITEIKRWGIIVIQSLNPNDYKTGEILYHDVLKYKEASILCKRGRAHRLRALPHSIQGFCFLKGFSLSFRRVLRFSDGFPQGRHEAYLPCG